MGAIHRMERHRPIEPLAQLRSQVSRAAICYPGWQRHGGFDMAMERPEQPPVFIRDSHEGDDGVQSLLTFLNPHKKETGARSAA